MGRAETKARVVPAPARVAGRALESEERPERPVRPARRARPAAPARRAPRAPQGMEGPPGQPAPPAARARLAPPEAAVAARASAVPSASSIASMETSRMRTGVPPALAIRRLPVRRQSADRLRPSRSRIVPRVRSFRRPAPPTRPASAVGLDPGAKTPVPRSSAWLPAPTATRQTPTGVPPAIAFQPRRARPDPSRSPARRWRAISPVPKASCTAPTVVRVAPAAPPPPALARQPPASTVRSGIDPGPTAAAAASVRIRPPAARLLRRALSSFSSAGADPDG